MDVAAALGFAAVAAAGCAEQTVAHRGGAGKEYFSTAKYGAASPRVVADGQPVPKGGGQYLVGRPYTVAGRTYVPSENENYTTVGYASWYGDAFHGRRTANGEVYDMAAISAAHPTMPLPSYARVTNLDNGRSIIVRVNDRGPYAAGRVVDVSSRAADLLDFKGAGTAKVKVEFVGHAPLDGSDDNQLAASLRTDGTLASLDGVPTAEPTMVADSAPQPSTPPQSSPPQKTLLSAILTPAPTPALVADQAQDATTFVAETPPASARRFKAPLPPERPYDLAQLIEGAPTAGVATPPPRPASNGGALYLADGAKGALRPPSGAFDKLRKKGKGSPLNDPDDN